MTRHETTGIAVVLLLVAGAPAVGALADVDEPWQAAPIASLVQDWQTVAASGAATRSSDADTAACGPGGSDSPWQASLDVACAWMARIATLGHMTSSTEQCDPTGTVCVVDNDEAVAQDPYCDAYRPGGAYGAYVRESGVYANGGSGDELRARAYAHCGYYFIGTGYSYGVQVLGGPGANDAHLVWHTIDNKANPTCNWPHEAHDRQATQVVLRAPDGNGGSVEVRWLDKTITPCDPSRYDATWHAFPWDGVGNDCLTYVVAGGTVHDLGGCPFGPPPAAPHPSEFPYGQLTA